MIKFLALVTLTALASAATLTKDSPYGLSRLPSSRIVGGETTSIEDVPYLVSVRIFGTHVCGGSIISKHWVVTAGHCGQNEWESYNVKSGSTYRIGGGYTHTVSYIVVHPDYNEMNNGVIENDIAVIRVRESFKFDKTRQPIALFNANEETPVGVNAIISGWGSTENELKPKILQTVTVPTISKEDCNKAYNNLGGIGNGYICTADPKNNKDACDGDDGGPMVVNGRLAGVVAWGNGCAQAGYPRVYTEISAFDEFITSNARG